MIANNTTDFNVRGTNHPRYNQYRITEERRIELLLQKLETCLMTNKGEVLGDPNFGCDLEYYLWKTDASKETIKTIIYEQVNKYIPELLDYNFKAEIELYEGTYRDIMFINITIKNSEVQFTIK